MSGQASTSETFAFQAEINQLLSLIINAFYSHKEVFLRELVSNASDALDKIRHISLTDARALDADTTLEIRITPDKEARTLTIEDSGIGMTRDDLVKYLGTIAHSGTKQFMQALADAKDKGADVSQSLIGQFGMGFYSAFLVADTVRVVSKHNDSASAWVWESTANGSFTVFEDTTADLKRGTKVILFVKPDHDEYFDETTLKNIVSKHSEFINYPIKLLTEVQEQVADEDVGDDADDGEVKEVTVDDKNKKMKTVTRKEFKVVNENKPLWMQKPADVSEEQYGEFYKKTFSDWDTHLAVSHFATEGQVVFTGMLFIPKHAPFDMFDRSKKNTNVRLYVRRVFITDDCSEMVPDWLGFVKGVVDSEDLPLNVSREMLQKSKVMSVINKTIVKKAIELMGDLAESRPQDYVTFWKTFGKNVKWGVCEDKKNQAKLLDLLRFKSSKSNDDYTTLKDYVSRMKEGQKSIYFITGDNEAAMKASVFTESLMAKGYEVMYMTDPIDEYMMQGLREYAEKPFKCASKDGAVDDEEGETDAEVAKANEEFCTAVRAMLGTERSVTAVKVSKRIIKSPCVIVTDQYGWTANMERIMRAQALRNDGMFGHSQSNKILELNLDHPIIQHVKAEVARGSQGVKDIVAMLYDTALLNSGFMLDNPSAFADRMHKIIAANLNLDEVEDTGGEAGGDTSGEAGGEAGGDTGTGLEELD